MCVCDLISRGRHVDGCTGSVFGGSRKFGWNRDIPEPCVGGSVAGEDSLIVMGDGDDVLVERHVAASITELPN